jgi:hypothetical protein
MTEPPPADPLPPVPPALRVPIGLLLVALVWTPLLLNAGWCNADELELLHGLQGKGVSQVVADLPGHFAAVDGLFYRPFGYFCFRLQLALAQGGPQLTLVISLLHHLANLGLLALLLRRCGRSPRPALLLLLLPAVVPGVAWAAAVYERLLLTFALGILLLLLSDRRLWQWLTLVLFALALCTKETAVVLPLVALAVAWRRQPNARWPAFAMLLAAAAFAYWRVSTGAAQQDPNYHGRPASEAALTLLRLCVQPCAITAAEPGYVWGWHWLPGIVGMAVLAVLALARAPGQAMAAGALFVLPLLAVAPWSTAQGHYLYLAAPGLALLTALALDAQKPWTWLLLLPLVAHSVVIALYYRSTATAMRNLDQAYRALPASSQPVDVYVLDGGPSHVVLRYRLYLEKTGQRPMREQATGTAVAGSLVLHPDNSVTTTG